MEGRLPGSPLVQFQSMALEYMQPLSHIFLSIYIFLAFLNLSCCFLQTSQTISSGNLTDYAACVTAAEEAWKVLYCIFLLKKDHWKNSNTNIIKVWADVTAPHRGEIVRQVRFGTVILGGFHLKIGRRRVETEAGTPWQACQPGDGEDCSRGYWRGARVCWHLRLCCRPVEDV